MLTEDDFGSDGPVGGIAAQEGRMEGPMPLGCRLLLGLEVAMYETAIYDYLCVVSYPSIYLIYLPIDRSESID